MSRSASITQIPSQHAGVYAFEIRGRVSADELENMAKAMNDAFDSKDKVNLLLFFKDYEGTSWDAPFDDDVIEANFRALKHVDKYAVVGAPNVAERMINIFNKMTRVKAKTFTYAQTENAWEFINGA